MATHLRKIGWMHSVEKLQLFHQKLFFASKISCDYHSFENHFIGTAREQIDKIEWTGSGLELIHLISQLMNREIIPFDACYINHTAQHFIRSNGMPFYPTSLRTLKSRPSSLLIEKFISRIVREILQ